MADRVELIGSMLQENPEDLFLNYAMGLEMSKLKQYNEAEVYFTKTLQIDKGYQAAYYQLGKLYEAKGLLDKAILTYKDGMELAKKNNDVKTLGELEEALLILE